MSDVDNNSTHEPSGDGTRDVLKIVGVAIGTIVLIYVAYIGSAVFQLMKLSDSYPITGIRSGAPAQVDRNYSNTPEVPIESIAAEAGLPAPTEVGRSWRFTGLDSEDQLIAGVRALHDYREGFSGGHGTASGTIDGQEWTFTQSFSPAQSQNLLDAREHFTTVALDSTGRSPSLEFTQACSTPFPQCADDIMPHVRATVMELPEISGIHRQLRLVLTQQTGTTATLWAAGAPSPSQALEQLNHAAAAPELGTSTATSLEITARRAGVTVNENP